LLEASTTERDSTPRSVSEPMLDRMFLHGIEARGWHGVLDFERRDGQLFVVDVD
jgi:hypothetical protein